MTEHKTAAPLTVGSITVELKDGRVFDMTNVPPETVVAMLQAAGVRVEDIARTIHVVQKVCGLGDE